MHYGYTPQLEGYDYKKSDLAQIPTIKLCQKKKLAQNVYILVI